MTAAVTLPICEVRIGKPDDLAFVVDCWVKNDPELRTRRLGEATRHVRALLSRHDSRLIIACVSGEPDAILGWAATESNCVHYVYVRRDARRAGVARAMVGHVQRCEYSHVAPKGFVVPSGWTFNRKRA